MEKFFVLKKILRVKIVLVGLFSVMSLFLDSRNAQALDKFMACETPGQYNRLEKWTYKRANAAEKYAFSNCTKASFLQCRKRILKEYPRPKNVNCSRITARKIKIEKRRFGTFCVRQADWSDCLWIKKKWLDILCRFTQEKNVWKCSGKTR